ncbi:uncharacterized protein NEMAJ01_1108 [Nematocida major]|uniref:uncharacterized protein n=1 Tax=Nematocida major TaxID=1912982 RepID=UPI0020081DDE|nr:uncharacterized protein NEMAJ01_1108 [Nematocida major]KAH9386212.1 hypothetical protein NEMAJ01_1108 [Nematocida major]
MLKKLRKIHSSAHSSVYLAEETDPGKYPAASLVLKNVKNANSREIHILKRIRHINVVEAYDQYGTRIVMPYYRHTLKEVSPVENVKYRNYIIKCIVDGLTHIHSLGIVHRDIKPQNILVDGLHVKITDFGSSREIESMESAQGICGADSAGGEKEMTGIVGTLNYIPPEILLGCKRYGREVDLWAAGCTFWEILCGEVCFEGDCEIAQIGKIVTRLGVSESDKKTLDKYPFSGLVPITPKKSLFERIGCAEMACLLKDLLRYDAEGRTFSGAAMRGIVSADYVFLDCE